MTLTQVLWMGTDPLFTNEVATLLGQPLSADATLTVSKVEGRPEVSLIMFVTETMSLMLELNWDDRQVYLQKGVGPRESHKLGPVVTLTDMGSEAALATCRSFVTRVSAGDVE